MNYDAFFRMGSKHSVCQDYAIAGPWFTVPYAIVSDGCSGITDPLDRASPYTDWGARLLAWHTREALGPISEGRFPESGIMGGAKGIANILLLPSDALAATLLVAVRAASGDILAYQVGDGVIAWRTREGEIGYETVRYAGGAPRYLSYLLDPKAHEKLMALSDPDDDLEPGTLEVTENTWALNRGWGTAQKRVQRYDASTPYARQLRFPKENEPHGSLFPPIETVVLFSDGVESFVDRDNQEVPLEAVLPELLAFKKYEGEFVTRRCRKFLDKVYQYRGWQPHDDFSMAALSHADSSACGLRLAAPDPQPGSEQKKP